MEINQVLGITGISVSIFFGIIGIIFVRKKKYLGRINFIEDYSIDLYDSIVNNIDELKILYKNKEVNQNMSLLRFYLINLGAKDITREMVEKELKLVLPKNTKILNWKLIKCSPDLNCTIDCSDINTIIFNFGLFRIDEFCQIELLLETKLPNQISNSFNFSHRIADTVSGVKKIRIDSQVKDNKYFRKKLLPLLASVIILLISTIIFSTINFNQSKEKLKWEIVRGYEYSGAFSELIKSVTDDSIKLPESYKTLRSELQARAQDYIDYTYIFYLGAKEGSISLILIAIFFGFCSFFISSFLVYKRNIKILSIIG